MLVSNQIKRSLVQSFAILIFALITGLIIAKAPGKYVGALGLLIVCTPLMLRISIRKMISAAIVLTMFPVTMRFMGNDAMTIGTLMVFILFGVLLYYNPNNYRWNNLAKEQKMFFALLIIAAIGALLETPPSLYGPVIRRYVTLMSCFMLFLVITNSIRLPAFTASSKEYIEKLINIVLFTVAFQIVISIVLWYDPSFQDYLKIFYERTQTELVERLPQYGNMVRTGILFTGGEEYGELLAVLFPFVIYKAITSKKKYVYLYWGMTLLYIVGVTLSGTRSALLLLGFQTVAVIAFFRSGKVVIKLCIGIVVVTMLGLVCLKVYPDMMYMISGRMSTTFGDIEQTSNITSSFAYIMNREQVWPQAWSTTINNLSLLGHGPTVAYMLGIRGAVSHFHCLYLTVLFQYGIIGCIVFFWFFWKILKKLLVTIRYQNSTDEWALCVLCVISFISFLINEIKFEFNRGDSYQQVLWIVIGIYYLAGRYMNNHAQDPITRNA